MTSLACKFGDDVLKDIMLVKLDQQLGYCSVGDLLGALSILYAEGFNRLPNIQTLRRVVVVEAHRRGFRSITHDQWREIGELRDEFPNFKNDLDLVEQATSEIPEAKKARIERTAT